MKTEAQRLRRNELAREYRKRHKEKVAARLKLWNEKNREHVKAYAKRRRAARTPEEIEKVRASDRIRHAKKREKDREAYNERLRKWSQANPDKIKIRNYKWMKNNKDKVRAARIRRRAPSGLNPFTYKDIQSIRKLQRNKCGYCRTNLSPEIEHIDHIIALANGGTNDRTNIQLLCARCNKRKAKRDPIAFSQSMGNLL